MNENRVLRAGITAGDIGGVGTEVIIKALADSRIYDNIIPVVYGSAKAVAFYKKGIEGADGFSVSLVQSAADAAPKRVNLVECGPEDIRVEVGKSTAEAGAVAVTALQRAMADVEAGDLDLLITAPINKENVYGENFPYEEVRKYRTEVFEQKIDRYGIPLKPYAVELLQWLSENKYIIALATSGNSERAERFLRIAKIIQYFDAIVCSDIVQKGKPSPDTYSTACIILGTEPDSVVAVEDSPNGVESAYSAGCNVIMVPDFTAPDPRTRDKLYACVNSLRDIIDILS